ncbi:hypothetical protein LTR16_000257 [Cryomyces antarcticus]|uniref:Uncharacterized protein n=1 Tax=Cryomyces antarcticus TaxID=329879 RepID=A0ABR0M905_9PEZI|nr:hypothetical protein LTR16_000257 [Cryomyces antarcticus]
MASGRHSCLLSWLRYEDVGIIVPYKHQWNLYRRSPHESDLRTKTMEQRFSSRRSTDFEGVVRSIAIVDLVVAQSLGLFLMERTQRITSAFMPLFRGVPTTDLDYIYR